MALLDLHTNIIATNHAWNEFGRQNGLPAAYSLQKANYLDICEASASAGSTDAEQALVGLLGVTKAGHSDFAMIYPCHAPHEQRWFKMRAQLMLPDMPNVLVSHSIIRCQPSDLNFQ